MAPLSKNSHQVLLLLLAMIMSSTVFASPAGGILIQDSACSASGVTTCPAGLPSNFCCSHGTTCMPLAGNTTAVCCPSGSSCNRIQPITCDVSQQNPDQHANSPIMTSIFNIQLSKCGSATCCPFGYSCVDGDVCQKDDDQSESPSQASSTTSSAVTTATTASETAVVSTPASLTSITTFTTAPAPAPPAATTSAAASSHASNPKTVSIIGGVVGACAVLILVGVIVFLYIRRNRGRKALDHEKRNAPGMKNAGPLPLGSVISDPIMQPNSYRTDFILKRTPSMQSINLKSPSVSSSISQRPPNITFTNTDEQPPRLSIPNPFNSPNPSAHSVSPIEDDDQNARTGHVVVGARLQPIRAMKASSTRVYPQNLPRDPSSENINIFADPQTVAGGAGNRYTHQTTFTDLMDEADLGDVRRGKPYVPGTTPRI